MAANSSSLRFTVEVATDQADQALKAMTLAFNQAGAQARIAMQGIGGASKGAGAEVVSLGDKIKGFAREQRSEARAVSFFVGELSQIVPVSGSAKMALSGIGQAFVGGAGIASMVGVAVASAGALALALRNAREESSGLNREIVGLESRLRVIAMVGAGGALGGARTQLDEDISSKMAEIRGLNQQLDEKRKSAVRFLPGEAVVEEKLRKAWLELEIIRAEGAKRITELERQESEKRVKIAEDEQKRKQKTAADAYAERLEEARWMARGGEAYGLSEDANLLAKPTAAQKTYNAEVERSIDLQKQWGQALGDVFSQMITGQMSARDAFKAILSMAIRQIITSAMVASAKSAEHGAAAGGPVGAAGALAFTQALVLGLLGSLPSARGGWWDTGSYEGLAMVHQREMVLPAREAEAVRRGAGGITINVAAFDGQSAGRVFTAHDGEVQRALRKAQRRAGG